MIESFREIDRIIKDITRIYRFSDVLALWGAAHLAPWEISHPMPEYRWSLSSPKLLLKLLGWWTDPTDKALYAIVQYKTAEPHMIREQEWEQSPSAKFNQEHEWGAMASINFEPGDPPR